MACSGQTIGHYQTRSFSLKADAVSWTRLVERGIDTGAIDDGSIPHSSMSVGDLLRCYNAEILPSRERALVESYTTRNFIPDTNMMPLGN